MITWKAYFADGYECYVDGETDDACWQVAERIARRRGTEVVELSNR